MNYILSILFIKLLIDYIVKPNTAVLNCGIWGFYGNNKKFSWDKFNILGIMNDSRGGDAAGRVVGNTVLHDSNKHKLYRDLCAVYKNEKITKDISYIGGHVRKSSLPANKAMIEYAQPFYNFDGENINKVFSHNGVIHNANDLHKELELGNNMFSYFNEKGAESKVIMNDSRILFEAIKNDKFEILEKYTGAAAIAFYDKDKDELILYKGKSLHSNKSTEATEERPLYVLQGNGYIWYSSEEAPLYIIAGDEYEIIDIEPNNLHIFKDGKLDRSIPINRNNCMQSITYKSTKTYHNYNRNDEFEDYGEYNSYNDWYNKKWGADTTPKVNRVVEGNAMQLSLQIKSEDVIKDSKVVNSDAILAKEGIFSPAKFMINYYKLLYYVGTELANGIIKIDSNGVIWNNEFTPKSLKTYYFHNGFMIRDHADYNTLVRELKTIRSDKKYRIAEMISKASDFPVFIDNRYYYLIDGKFFNGEIKPLFSYNTYKFNFGKLVDIKTGDLNTPKYIEHKKCPGCGIDILPFEDKCPKCIEEFERSVDKAFEQEFKEAVNEEIESELSSVMSEIHNAKNVISSHIGDKFATKALTILGEMELAIDNLIEEEVYDSSEC